MTTSAGPRRVAWLVLLVGLIGFVVIAWWRVPWHPAGDAAPTPVAASSVFSQSQIDRAEAYSWWARGWSWSGLALTMVALWWLALSRRGKQLVRRMRGPWWVRVLLGASLVRVVVWLVGMPFAVAQQEHQRRNGLSAQPWSGFARDLAVGLAIDVVVTCLLLLVLVACARRWRRAWPAAAAVLAGGLVLLGSYGYPLVVEPLFNNFHSLPQGTLRTDVLRLAHIEGVRLDDVLVADASRRTTTLNAYVSGFGGSRRVVLYDTLVRGEPRSSVLAVVSHELAHARDDDVLTGTLLGVAGSAVGVGLLGLVLGERRGRSGTSTRSAADPASVALVLALVLAGTVLASPVQNAVSRRLETRADVIGLRATGDPQGFVALQRQLALRSLQDPTPPTLSQWWFGSHPTVLQRIALAREP